MSLRLAEGAEVAETAPAMERRHGSLKEKRVATQKSCPEHLIKASCRPFSHRHTCTSIWDLRFALDLRLYLSQVALVQARLKHTN